MGVAVNFAKIIAAKKAMLSKVNTIYLQESVSSVSHEPTGALSLLFSFPSLSFLLALSQCLSLSLESVILVMIDGTKGTQKNDIEAIVTD